MNFPITVYSSLLLIIPALHAYNCGFTDVFVASMICAITSTLHHGNGCKDATLATIDRAAVRIISVAYILHALLYFNNTAYVLILALCGAVTGALYMKYAFFTETEEIHDMHAMIHLCAMMGMFQYINARKWN